MKECRRCGTAQPTELFAKSAVNKDGLGSYCRPCRNAYARERYVAKGRRVSPEKNRANARRYRYGITEEQYERMLEQQNRSCAVCKVEFSDKVKPYIDHDHNCCPGKVTCGVCFRGILCSGCNAFAGLIETRFDTCDTMFTYLRLHLEAKSNTLVLEATEPQLKPMEV